MLEDRMMLRKKNIYRLWAFTPHLRGRLISLLLAVFLYLLETAEVLAWCLRCFIAGFLFTVWAYLVCVLFADTSVHANDLPQNHLDIANVWLWQPYIQSCNSIMQVIFHTTILKKILTSIFILRMLFLVVRSLFWLNVCVVIGNFSGWSIIRRQGSILPHRTSVPWLLLTEESYTSGHECMVVELQVLVIPSNIQNHPIGSTTPLLLSIILGVGKLFQG